MIQVVNKLQKRRVAEVSIYHVSNGIKDQEGKRKTTRNQLSAFKLSTVRLNRCAIGRSTTSS